MITYYSDKETLAQFVSDLLTNSNLDWRSITIMSPDKYADYCVSIATDMSLEDIDKSIQNYYVQHLPISLPTTPDG